MIIDSCVRVVSLGLNQPENVKWIAGEIKRTYYFRYDAPF